MQAKSTQHKPKSHPMLPYYIFRRAQPGRSWELRVANAIDLSRVVLFAKRVVDRAVTIRLSNVNVRSSFAFCINPANTKSMREVQESGPTEPAKITPASLPLRLPAAQSKLCCRRETFQRLFCSCSRERRRVRPSAVRARVRPSFCSLLRSIALRRIGFG